MSRIVDLCNYCVNTKYILSVSKGEFTPHKEKAQYKLYVQFRYNEQQVVRIYSDKQERDRDYKKIINEWKNNTDKYGD